MPYKSEKLKIAGTKQDRRIKISDDKKKEIIALKGKISQRKCAELFGISRRSVVFLWFPERLEQNKQRRQERGGWRQYYNKKEWAETMKEHRHYKQEVYLVRRNKRWAHLFKNTDVFYTRIEGHSGLSAIHSYASSIGVKIKLTPGVWFNTKTEQAEKLYKIEIIERRTLNELLENEAKINKEKEQKEIARRARVQANRERREAKKEKIIALRCQNKKIQEIADIMGCSKQYISYVLCKKRREA